MIDKNNIPHHVAIIMDGNGRWARMRNLPRTQGHRAGIEAIGQIAREAKEMGIKVLTLFAFSTENWQRPKKEVNMLMRTLGSFLKKQRFKLDQDGIRIKVIGKLSGLPVFLQSQLKETMEATKENEDLIINLALNYGARQEIVDTTKRIVGDVLKGNYKVADINEDYFSKNLYTQGLPDPDLLIRTSGEMRISNFLLWQISYTELYFSKKLWPDFKRRDLERAIEEYQMRERRFGKVN